MLCINIIRQCVRGMVVSTASNIKARSTVLSRLDDDLIIRISHTRVTHALPLSIAKAHDQALFWCILEFVVRDVTHSLVIIQIVVLIFVTAVPLVA